MASLLCVSACGLLGGARMPKQRGTAGSGEASLLRDKKEIISILLSIIYRKRGERGEAVSAL